MVSSTQKDNSSHNILMTIIVFLCVSLTYVCFGTFFQYLWLTWKVDPFYQHGMWIAGLSVGLYGIFLWKKRKASFLIFKTLDQTWSILFFLLAVIFFIIGVQTQMAFFAGVSLMLWLLSLQFLFFSVQAWKEYSFPFIYFLLAVPLPYLSELSGILQLWVAHLTYVVFHALGYPIVQSGIRLELPSVVFQIAADCTGIKSWLVLFSLILFFLYWIKLRFSFKIILSLLVVPVAFVVNFLRVLSLFVVGLTQGQEVAMHHWHHFAGIYFYGLSCTILLGIWIGFLRYDSGPK